MRFPRTSYYMPEHVVLDKCAPDGSQALVLEHDGLVLGIAWGGRADRPAYHYRYRTREAATQKADEFIAGRLRHLEAKQARKQERTDFRTSLEVGNVLDASWGYDQTNIDFYEVVEVSHDRRYVTIRPVAQGSVDTAYMQGDCWPRTGVYIGEPTRHRVLPGDSVKVRDWGVWASLWRGRVRHFTSYA